MATKDLVPDGTPNTAHEHWQGDGIATWDLGDVPNGDEDPGTGHIHPPEAGLDWDSVEVDHEAPKGEPVDNEDESQTVVIEGTIEAEYDDAAREFLAQAEKAAEDETALLDELAKDDAPDEEI